MAKKTGGKIQDQQAPIGGGGNGSRGPSEGSAANGSQRQPEEGAQPSGSRDSMMSDMEIAARAYEIYEREGRTDGRAMDHWLQAEAELRRERQNKNSQSDLPRSARQHQGTTGA